jgi:hypothetical protein
MYPPNVQRGQILKIWPDFEICPGGIFVTPQCHIYPLIENAFLKKLEIYSNTPLHIECPKGLTVLESLLA